MHLATLLLIGCNHGELDELRAENQALILKNQDLEARLEAHVTSIAVFGDPTDPGFDLRCEDVKGALTALRAKLNDPEPPSTAPDDDEARERDERREALRERLALRRLAREGGDEEEPGVPLRTLLQNRDEASRMGRAITHQGPDDTPDGYRLSAIRRNSPLDRLGLNNGDIIHSVDGQPLTNLTQAMAIYEGITPQTTAVTLSITRRGDPLELVVPLDTVPPPPTPEEPDEEPTP